MSLDERRRHELHDRLQGALGPEPAATLMEQLVTPKDDIAQLHTKVDRLETKVDHQGELLRAEMVAMRTELMAAFRAEINTAMTSQTRAMVITNASLFIAFAGLVLALKLL